MIFNQVKIGKNTKDATIISKDVMKDEIAYGADGKIIGEAPLSYISTNELEIDTYQIEDTNKGVIFTAEGCPERKAIIARDDSGYKLKFEDEPVVETSTTDIEEGSSTDLPEGSLYIVYKEA